MLYHHLKELIGPCITQANATISYVNEIYQPYSVPASFVSYVTSVGLTGYGLYPIWASTNEASTKSKVSLTMLYGIHIGSVGFALANMLGQGDYAPSTISALVGATAMFKSLGDYWFESAVNQNLHEKRELVQSQFHKDNLEFNRCLILIADRKEIDSELYLLSQEQSYLKDALNRLNAIKLNKEPFARKEFNKLIAELKNSAHQKMVKHNAILELVENGTPKKSSSELQEAIVALRHERDKAAATSRKKENLQKLDEEIEICGYQYQYCIKYKKTHELINKINEQLTWEQALTDEEIGYYRQIINDLKVSLEPLRDPLIFQIITPHFDETETNFSKIKALFRNILRKQISQFQVQLNAARRKKIEKEEKFSQFSKFAPNEIHKDFECMCKTMEELVELQNKATLAVLSEKSKEKSANFSMISSALALLICVLPNIHHTKRLSQLKNGVGFLALIVSNIDMLRKYILSMRLSAKENRQLQLLLQNTSFNNIVQANDKHLRDHLLNKINLAKNDMAIRDEEPVLTRRMAKEKAKVLIFDGFRRQGTDKKVSLTLTNKQSTRSKTRLNYK